MTLALATEMDRPSEREVRFSRLLDAPRELVWRMWSEPQHVHRWFGPAGFTTTTQVFDFRPGGQWIHTMHGPDGTDYPNRVVFREIDPPARLVYENGWDLPGAPLDFQVVVTFQPEGPKTRLTLHMTFYDAATFKTAVETYGVLQGGIETLDRFAEEAAELGRTPPDTSDREIVTVRVIRATRDRVWDAWTIPDQWKHWWGPDGFTNTIHVMEVKSGGRWEFIMHGPDGTDYRNESQYLQVIRPEYLEYRHHSTPGFVAYVNFQELGANTQVTLRLVLDSAADFERAVKVFHAREGAQQTLARLAALVER